MNFEEFKEFFIQNIKIINVNLKEDELNNLYIYMKEWEWTDWLSEGKGTDFLPNMPSV